MVILVSGWTSPTILTTPRSLPSARKDFFEAAKRLPRPEGECEAFVLDLTRKDFCKDLPNRGLFAVYKGLPGPFISAPRLFVTRSPHELRKRLRALYAKGVIPTGCVYAQTAASKGDFTDLEHEYTVRRVLKGIEKIKKRGDKATLLLVRRVLERKGLTPGPKRQEYASAWKIDTLRNLAKGLRFEVAVIHPARKLALDSARQELWKYCREFYRWCKIMGLHTPKDWQRSRGHKSFLRFRFGLELPRDRDAWAEAYRRGKRTDEKHLAR